MIKEYLKGGGEELSRRFNLRDFDCKCEFPECDFTLVDTDLLDGLESLWDLVGEIYVISGYRCSTHNKVVKGKTGSSHLVGKAADIYSDLKAPQVIAGKAENLQRFKNGGIGRYRTFVHLDVRGYKARWNG